CDFFLEDETGKALVRMPPTVVRYTKNPATRVTEAGGMEAFLSRHGRLVGNHSWRAGEWVLGEGRLIAVFGIGRWEPDPDPGCSLRASPYREAPQRLVVSAPANLRLLISDQPELASRRSGSLR